MSLIEKFQECTEAAETDAADEKVICSEAIRRYDELLGDADSSIEIENREKDKPGHHLDLNNEVSECYEVDDAGDIYKVKGELLSNSEYTVHGNRYRTDQNGNIVLCESSPRYTEDGIRNSKEQMEAGGEERKADDDGGHIIARVLGGTEGAENLVPMRRTINRGDYKKMENEISRALQENKKVDLQVELTYAESSQRPSLMKAEYTIDETKSTIEFDNKENSTELLSAIKKEINKQDYAELIEEVHDMQEDESAVSITSVKIEYAENNKPVKATIGVLDETSGEKTYKVYAL